MRIFLIAPFRAEYRDIVTAIKEAVYTNYPKNYIVSPEDLQVSALNSQDEHQQEISNSDLVIAEVSEGSATIVFEVGVAKALNKPILLLAQQNSLLPSFAANYLLHSYDRNRLQETLVLPLVSLLSRLDITKGVRSELNVEREKIKTVFISYSRNDREYLERLLTHIRPLERTGKVDIWADDKIKAGEKWKEVIEKALGRAGIAILLLSGDFLASDFIIDNELPPLLKSAEERGTAILPLILKPCLFRLHETLSQFQAINDPKNPLSKLSENDREEILVQAAERIYTLLKK